MKASDDEAGGAFLVFEDACRRARPRPRMSMRMTMRLSTCSTQQPERAAARLLIGVGTASAYLCRVPPVSRTGFRGGLQDSRGGST